MEIVKIIQQTATWIETVNNDFESNLYRTPALIPNRHLLMIDEAHQSAVIAEVAKRRSNLLEDAKTDWIAVDELHRYGRLAAFDINSSLADGAPQMESENFVDIFETPPVDTWITTGKEMRQLGIYHSSNPDFQQAVIAWVPALHYYYVEQASQVSIIDNISWLDPNAVDPSFEFLKPLFGRPEQLDKPQGSINRTKRAQLMQEFEEKLDRNEDYFKQQASKPEKHQNTSQSSNWEINGLTHLWNWFSKLLARA